jgi:hypothetical protein
MEEYLPIIRKIFAYLELRLIQTDLMESKQKFNLISLEENSPRALANAISIIASWVQDSGFAVESYGFIKTRPDAKWATMLKVMTERISGLRSETSFSTELTLSKVGRVARMVNDETLNYDLERKGLKLKILLGLAKSPDFLTIEALQELTGSDSEKSLTNAIRQINALLKGHLQLPPGKKIIEGVKGSGYRIHPLYSIVIVS